MINFPNINGLKYFIGLCTINRGLPYLPIEIREIIWNMSEKIPHIICCICNNVQLRLNIYCKN